MVTLHAGTFGNITPPITYLWSTGATTQDISVLNGSGAYSVTITDAVGCTATHSVDLTNIANFSFNIQAYNLCPNEGGIVLGIDWHMLNVPINAAYLWSTGETMSYIVVQNAGIYSVTITDPVTGCSVVREINAQYSPMPEPQITGPMSLCTGETITLTVTGGPFTSINWDPNSYSGESIEVSTPGIYIVTVFNEFNCYASDTFEVISSGENIVLNGPFHLCMGQSETLSVINANQFNSFEWNTGETTSSITVNSAGIYSVTATDLTGCIDIEFSEVTSSNIAISVIINPNSSCTTPNGAIDLTASAVTNLSYIWSNGSTNEDLTGLQAGTYTVTITDEYMCSASWSIEVPADNLITPILNTIATPATCGQSNGSIDLDVNPPGIYTYLWSNGATTEDISNLDPDTYTVTVTGINGCSATISTLVINNNTTFNTTGVTSPNTSCTSPNGSINITVLPVGAYTYIWSNGQTSEDIINSAADTYTVTITDAFNCNLVENYIIDENFTLPVLNTTPIPASCGQANGSITLDVSPTGSYTYWWSNGATTEDISNLDPDTYTVTVTGINGCSATISTLVINNNTTFNTTVIASPNTSCTSSNGSINITVLPDGAYIYIWSNGQTSEDIINLAAGTYTVTITDASGCSLMETFEIDDNTIIPVLNATPIHASCGQANGSIVLDVSPVGTYTFLWSNGAITEDINNLIPGTYTVTVTGINGCTSVISALVVNNNTSFNTTGVTSPNTSCNSPNGSVNITVLPSGTYTFNWSNGKTSKDIINLSAGTYTVTITDTSNCSSTMSFEIDDNTIIPVLNATPIPASCGQANGSIVLDVIPVGTYTFLWSNGAITEDINNLIPGTYTVTVTGINGCTSVISALVVNNNTAFNTTGLTSPNTSCVSPNGSVNIAVLPASAYTYIWSNGQTSEDIINLAAGTYTVTITDAANCSLIETFIIVNSTIIPVLNATATPASCGQENGSIALDVSPVGTYTFLWSNGATTEDINNLIPGTYTVTVTGSNGCASEISALVINNNTSFNTTGVTSPNTSCISSNGSVNITVLPASTYSFIWSNGQTSEDILNLSAGTYTVTITDASNCSSTMTFEIVNNTIIPILNVTPTPSSCGKANGSIALDILPSGSYTYSWSNGATNEDISNLAPGTYTVTVTSISGCTTVISASVIINNSSFSTNGVISPNTSCVLPNGSVNITVSSGIYTFAWSNGNTTEDIYNLPAGNYTVTVTDVNLCKASYTFTVLENLRIPEVELLSHGPDCNGKKGWIEILIPENPQIYSYSINGGTNFKPLNDINNLVPGVYELIIKDSLGCTSVNSVVIPDIQLLIIDPIPDIILEIGETVKININIKGIDYEQIDTVLWSPSDGLVFENNAIEALLNPTILPLVTGVYTIIIISKDGCQYKANINVKINYGIYIPNIIIPESTLGNHSFYLTTKPGTIKNIRQMLIFDRWGELVYENNNFLPNDPAEGWQGIFRDQPVNPAVFAWIAEVELFNNKVIIMKGDVTVIR